MSNPRYPSERFGEQLATALGAGPGKATLNAQRAEIMALAQRLGQGTAGGGPRQTLAWALAAAVTVILLGGGLYLHLREPVLRASFGGQEVADQRQLWAQTRPQALTFSDGSEVLLELDARAQVSRITTENADLELTQGSIFASIHKGGKRTWTIKVGPYSVRVVGTRFRVDWQRRSRTLKVEVSEGRVRVSGGALPLNGVALDAGARLEQRDRPEVARSDPPAPTPPSQRVLAPGAVPASEQATARPLGSEVSARNEASPASSGSAASFVGLANKGKYREAVELAEKQGFERLSSTLPENDLVTLANAARFSGNSARAREALLKLRQRFPGRPAAELAALYLARVAEDLERQPSEAARWLRVFLQESPAGDLAAGARANLMSVLLAAGDTSGARAVAEDYVHFHPSGPHLAKARALLDKTR